MESIGQINESLASLLASDPALHALFVAHFEVAVREGELALPPALEEKVGGWFSLPSDDDPQKASVERACRQRVICIRNRHTSDATHFNPLRALRPSGTSGAALDQEDKHVDQLVAGNEGAKCDFCAPVEKCALDTWGRVEGSHWISGANVAKFEGHHGVLLLKRHHPLAWEGEGIADLLSTWAAWAARTHEVHPDATHPLLLWNCLPRAGSSQLHGHAQCTLSPGGHVGMVRTLAEAAGRYLHAPPPGTDLDYLGDLVRAHAALGLARDMGGGVWVIAYLCARKEKELWVVGPPGGAPSDLAHGLWVALKALRGEMGVRCFNVVAIGPPVAGPPPLGFARCMARVIDRGSARSGVSDMAAAEMFAVSVVAADPVHVIAAVDRAAAAAGPPPAAARLPPAPAMGSACLARGPSAWVARWAGMVQGGQRAQAPWQIPPLSDLPGGPIPVLKEAAGQVLDVACGSGRCAPPARPFPLHPAPGTRHPSLASPELPPSPCGALEGT
mmetsp:Transcript_1301/g.5290  ORF Transcript_1301/g.5290 Transcript_1301/m.5290 type:complete len:502 (+) Transcript_1301:722-2227(+)